MKTIHPAVAQHAMEENEKLRGLLRDVRILLAGSSYKISGTAAFLHSIDEALSNQAEPACSDERPCVSCFSDDGACLAEPAPAQGEREAFEVAHALRALAEQFKEAWPEHDGKYDFLVGAGSRIARAAPIAQTVPQCMAALEGWQLVPVEPTPEMREAFHEATERYEDGFGESPDSQWQAMLRAAQGDKP